MQLKLIQKKAIQETAEVAIDLTGNKIASNILKVLRKPPQNNSRTVESETEILKERYISPEKNHISCQSGVDAAAIQVDINNKQVIFKNAAPVTDCKT